MAAKKAIRLVSGIWTEFVGIVTSAGATNDGDFPVLDATGKLDTSVMPVGIGADTNVVVTSEALAANDMVNIYNVSGTATARKADASSPSKHAVGFVLAAVSSGANATVYSRGTNVGASLTPGPLWTDSATPGKPTSTVPSGTGKIVQRCGTAVSATAWEFLQGEPVTLA